MEILPIKQFVRENVSRFELANKYGRNKLFDLYNKKGDYLGNYNFYSLSSCEFLGIKNSLSSMRIFNEKFKPMMGEDVWMEKTYAEVKDKTKDIYLKAIPQTITTISTFFDFVNDKFKTVQRKSVLQNELIRLGKDDPDFIYAEEHPIYEELKEKPVYEQKVELLREGSISKVKEETRYNIKRRDYFAKIHSGIPFIFW